MMKERLVSELKKLAAAALLGLAYYVLVTNTDLGIPCVFNALTGLLCPACGISRMLISITRLDFYTAFGYNKLLFITLPIVFIVFIHYEVKYIKTGDKALPVFSKFVIAGEAVLLLIFGIVRNLI